MDTILIIIFFGLAAWYLYRHFSRAVKNKNPSCGCGGCDGCSETSTSTNSNPDDCCSCETE